MGIRCERMRKILLLLLVSMMLASCGISYSVPRATIHIDLDGETHIDSVRSNVSSFLVSKGFEDLGKDEEMLELLEWSTKQHEGDAIARVNRDSIDRIHRTRHFKNEDIEVDVMIIDYSDIAVKERFVNYQNPETKITDSPSVELNIYNYRPGGFSSEAHIFYKELVSFITSNNLGEIRVIFTPPDTNETEFYKVRSINLLSSAIWWLVVYVASISIFGFIISKLLRRITLDIKFKRALFTLSCTILSTPLPFPAATILVIVLPSVLAIPAIGSDYFTRIQDFAIPSFIVSAFLCALISFYFIRDENNETI